MGWTCPFGRCEGRALRLELTARARRSYARVRRDIIAENTRLLEFPPPTRRSLIRLIERLTAAVERRELVAVEDPEGGP